MSKSENIERSSNELIFGSDNPNAIEVIDLSKIFTGKNKQRGNFWSIRTKWSGKNDYNKHLSWLAKPNPGGRICRRL